jgi:hypothetical protein
MEERAVYRSTCGKREMEEKETPSPNLYLKGIGMTEGEIGTGSLPESEENGKCNLCARFKVLPMSGLDRRRKGFLDFLIFYKLK